LDSRIRFLRIYAFVLVALAVLGLWVLHIASRSGRLSSLHDYCVMGVLVYYLVTAVGLLRRNIWGYYLFKFFLYLLIISFPIGTFIAYKSLRYMRESDVKSLFRSGKGP